MKDIVEIRWHGRGGQGAKTASLLLADAAFNTVKYVQGFPEYGPERMGRTHHRLQPDQLGTEHRPLQHLLSGLCGGRDETCCPPWT